MRCDLLHIFNTAKENLALLLRRVKDSKTNVRKAALQVPGTDGFTFLYCGMLVVSDGPLTSCCPSTGPVGSPETQCDPYELGELVYAVGALQRPGCVCEEEGPSVCGRAACCESHV